MFKSRAFRRLTMLTLAVFMVVAMAIPAYAADFKFTYVDMYVTGTDFTVYEANSNKKVVPKQEATVKGTDVNCAPGTNGWGFRLLCKGSSSSNPWTLINKDGETLTDYKDVTARTFWLNGNYTIHPQYKSGYSGEKIDHYIAGRLDDVTTGCPYNFTGYFNSDYT